MSDAGPCVTKCDDVHQKFRPRRLIGTDQRAEYEQKDDDNEDQEHAIDQPELARRQDATIERVLHVLKIVALKEGLTAQTASVSNRSAGLKKATQSLSCVAVGDPG